MDDNSKFEAGKSPLEYAESQVLFADREIQELNAKYKRELAPLVKYRDEWKAAFELLSGGQSPAPIPQQENEGAEIGQVQREFVNIIANEFKRPAQVAEVKPLVQERTGSTAKDYSGVIESILSKGLLASVKFKKRGNSNFTNNWRWLVPPSCMDMSDGKWTVKPEYRSTIEEILKGSYDEFETVVRMEVTM